jgi:hypothetical protein
MKLPVVLQTEGVSQTRLAKLLNVIYGSLLLAVLAAHAHAGPIGICLVSSDTGTSNSSALYATAIVQAGCVPGFTSSIGPGGAVNPTSLAGGLTTATLSVSQLMPFGGTAVATSTASLNQGVLRDYSDSEGSVGGCGGSCTTTGGTSTAESLMSDNIHFTITNGASSAIVTMHAHLDGVIGFEGTTAQNYNIQDSFTLGGTSCWESLTGLGISQCTSSNFLTSSFSNQSASGFDFTGTFQVTNGVTDPFNASLQTSCQGGALCDFANTASFSLSLPSNVKFTSDSGVLFSSASTATPEVGTFLMAGVTLLGVGLFRRRNARIQQSHAASGSGASYCSVSTGLVVA